MYERFYNLRERPFALSPDPEYLYLSRVHREALDYIRYGFESRAGFIVVTGEIGAGKTTLLQTLLQRLDNRTVVARLVNTTLDPRELLETIMIDFGLDTAGKSKPLMLRDLGQFLVQQRAAGRRPLLVVDEAQNLSLQSLEEIRLLSNLETEKSKLLQILLAGQPNLREKLSTPELEQFRQRVAVSYHITPLDEPDTAAYINYRLQHAAIGRVPHFPADACALVYHLSRGIPRTINVICDAVLVFGFAEERHHVDRSLVEEAVRELQLTGVLPATTVIPPASDPAMAPALAIQETTAGAAMPLPPAPPAAAEPAPAVHAHVPPPVAPRAAAPVQAALDAELRRREQLLAQREQQIAEQRRIMAEEYRLLRRDKAAGGPAMPAGTAGRPGPNVRAGSRAPMSHGAGRYASPKRVKRPSFWQRLVRLFAGEPALR